MLTAYFAGRESYRLGRLKRAAVLVLGRLSTTFVPQRSLVGFPRDVDRLDDVVGLAAQPLSLCLLITMP